jgi:hypothetical protein
MKFYRSHPLLSGPVLPTKPHTPHVYKTNYVLFSVVIQKPGVGMFSKLFFFFFFYPSFFFFFFFFLVLFPRNLRVALF